MIGGDYTTTAGADTRTTGSDAEYLGSDGRPAKSAGAERAFGLARLRSTGAVQEQFEALIHLQPECEHQGRSRSLVDRFPIVVTIRTASHLARRNAKRGCAALKQALGPSRPSSCPLRTTFRKRHTGGPIPNCRHNMLGAAPYPAQCQARMCRPENKHLAKSSKFLSVTNDVMLFRKRHTTASQARLAALRCRRRRRGSRNRPAAVAAAGAMAHISANDYRDGLTG